MKKFLYSLTFCSLGILASAQAPGNYYNTATATGFDLKTQLYNIIKGHKDLGYGGLWTLYNKNDSNNGFLDKYDEKDNSIYDIYSEIPKAADPYTFIKSVDQCGSSGYKTEGDCYNREHLIPQSVFNKISPMVSDAFHIWPTDGYVNNKRDNFPFGVVNSASYTSKNG